MAKEETELLYEAVCLKAELNRELAPGMHTRHQCSCGKRSCRGNKCFLCLIKGYLNAVGEMQQVSGQEFGG